MLQNPKTTQEKKIQSISHKYQHKNVQPNIRKPNLATYNNNYIPMTTWDLSQEYKVGLVCENQLM